MVADVVIFDTGPSTLTDVGVLSYNNCVFSPLFATSLSGVEVKTNDGRSVKYLEITLKADGYVTSSKTDANPSTSSTMVRLARLLSQQAGTLVYTGRGFDININSAGGIVFRGPLSSPLNTSDVAWGPVPEIIDFQTLGGGLTAKILWQVKFRIPAISGVNTTKTLLQFNSETSVRHSDDGYSAISVQGTMEIPLTRRTPIIRTLTRTVDDLRSQIDSRIMVGIDLSRFRMTNRDIHISRDKRSMEWNFQAEEKPYMDLPPGCTLARGSYSVRPAKAGVGLCNWFCTLRATYTVARTQDTPRRIAWFAFLAMLRQRMLSSQFANIPPPGGNQNPGVSAIQILSGAQAGAAAAQGGAAGVGASLWQRIYNQQNQGVESTRRAWLIDFSIDEGMYLDSKTVSFSASWRLITTFSHILIASGLWKKLPERDTAGRNLWAVSMANIQGSQSWLPNKLDPALDVIVDFGGG